MSDLETKHCQACEGGVKPLTIEEAKRLMPKIPQWELINSGKEIARLFHFKNYYETMAFVNATAWISHKEDHHPDLEVGYNQCRMRYSTHSIGGLSENDFICAAKINVLVT